MNIAGFLYINKKKLGVKFKIDCLYYEQCIEIGHMKHDNDMHSISMHSVADSCVSNQNVKR